MTAFTPKYREYAELLEQDASKLGINLLMYPYSEQGSWMANAHYKATAIFHTLATRRESVLWLDADSRLTGPMPDAYEHATDFAARYVATPSKRIFDFMLNRVVDNHLAEATPAGGAMYFNYNPVTISMVVYWVGTLRKYALANDEQCLRHALSLHPVCITEMSWEGWYTSTWKGYENGKPPKGGVV
jgi:hypothetical protein